MASPRNLCRPRYYLLAINVTRRSVYFTVGCRGISEVNLVRNWYVLQFNHTVLYSACFAGYMKMFDAC